MRVGKEGGTLNSRLFESLRAEIIGGKLLPGQRLKAGALATSYDVSLNVIREALNRLAGERLVDFAPQFGFTVRSLSADDLEDLVEQRIVFESLALRKCMERSSVEWQSEVLAAHHRLARTPMLEEGGSGELAAAWLARHDEFHSTVLKGCGSQRLYQMIRQMAEAGEMYHRALLPVVGRDREMEAEHEALTQAVMGGDTERAVTILRTHQEKTRDLMVPLLREAEAEAMVKIKAPASRSAGALAKPVA
ncbi:MAG: putative regulatory protein [Rhizobacter sp.]|nr:putative regulatory protein [Rhizobacter sp.]